MRFGRMVAALAAITLASPVAAQPAALDVVHGMLQRMAANAEGVQDYTLTLRSGAMQSEVFVYLDGDTWEVATSDDDQFGAMLRGIVIWPSFHELDAELSDELSNELSAERVAEVATVSTETLNGHPADVVFLQIGELMLEGTELPDSVRLYLDADDRQIMRVQVRGLAAQVGEIAPEGGRMDMAIDYADYRETDGLTVPHTMRMSIDVELGLTDEQKAAVLMDVEAVQEELAGDDSEEARQLAAVIGIVLGLVNDGHVEIPATVESVRVNSGSPSWF